MKYLFLFSLCAFFIEAQAQQLQGKILFSRTRNGVDSLFALHQDGQTLEYVTNGFRPRISRKGRLMLFSRNLANPGVSYNSNMWVRDLQTHHDTLLVTNNDYLEYYDFSPSDREIVYSQGCNIYKVNTTGTNPYTYVGCNPCDCFSDNPKVRIADSALVYHNVHFGIYTSAFDGSGSVKIPHTYPGDLFPVWSANGQWVAYAKCTFGGYYVANDLFKIKPDGSDSTKLTNFTATDTLVSDPFWANDMQSLFVIGRIGGQPGLYRINASGNLQKTLIKAFPTNIPIWKYTLGLADSVQSVFTETSSPIEHNPFHIYPNPIAANGQLTLATQTAGRYTIYTPQGKLLTRSIHTDATRPVVVDLKTLNLANGIYLLQWADKNRVTTRKLVVE